MLLLTSCAPKPKVVEVTVPKTEMIFLIPEKIATPTKPSFEPYDTRYKLDEINNFKRLQRNTVLMKNYIKSLRNTIKYYEDEIDMLSDQKVKYEATNK